VLVELGVVEQRYRAVLEVLDEGVPVTVVARRYGVARQTVHEWLRRYADEGGLAGLADRSPKPDSCPHQMSVVVEARIVGLRREHPGWGPSRIRWELQRQGVDPLPGRSSVYRALVRHGLVEARKRRRRREDYRRWERGRAMELWQMDVMGRVHLAGGLEVKVVTGIDDHSRFIVCARVVVRATARPVCVALTEALRRHGVPAQILTDNGKVFTARFGTGPGPVMFDRICADNGIRHLLTAPYSPTTTGKVERLHKTMRAEFFHRRGRGVRDRANCGWPRSALTGGIAAPRTALEMIFISLPGHAIRVVGFIFDNATPLPKGRARKAGQAPPPSRIATLAFNAEQISRSLVRYRPRVLAHRPLMCFAASRRTPSRSD
jgi:transposase InsO family protein